MKDTEEKFNERIENAKRDASEAVSVRKQKEYEAKRVREEVIEPRLTRIKDFMARVEASYGK